MFGKRSGSGKVADSHQVDVNVKDGLPTTNIVGIPDTHIKDASTTYKDANIKSGTKQMAVGEVKAGVETGKQIGTQEEIVKVPRIVRTTETVTVPEVTMQKHMVDMPETKVVQEERVVKGYEMRPETVTREEVVLEQKEVPHPTTELRRVEAEKPVLKEHKILIARPNEIMRKVKVVRPETKTETVTAYRPVEKTKVVTVQRPYLVKRTIKQRQPVEAVDLVNITQPEIQEATMDVQVPVTETRSVEYTAAVTQIRPTGDARIEEQAKDVKRDPTSSDREPTVSTEESQDERDWSTIPVGLPFTELQKRTKQFDVTTVKDEVANVRQTWMKTVQIEKKGYKFVEEEFEITETEMRDYEETVVETVLEPYEKQVEVTVMREVVEEWPVTKGREESVTTSEVTLEPTSAMMPQVGSKLMTIDEPRTVTITEQIEKPHEVERIEVVDKTVTEMKQVEVERPVEGTKQIEVEKVETVYDDKVINNPVTEEKEVNVSEVQHGTETVRNDSVEYRQKDAHYRQAGTHIDPTKLDKEYVVDPATQKVDVKDEKIATAHKIGVNAGDVTEEVEPERKKRLFGMIADTFTGGQ